MRIILPYTKHEGHQKQLRTLIPLIAHNIKGFCMRSYVNDISTCILQDPCMGYWNLYFQFTEEIDIAQKWKDP